MLCSICEKRPPTVKSCSACGKQSIIKKGKITLKTRFNKDKEHDNNHHFNVIKACYLLVFLRDSFT